MRSVVFLLGAVVAGGLLTTILPGCQHTDGTTGAADRAQRDSLRSQVHGCWSLAVTAEGAQHDSLRAWLPAGSLPDIVELDTVRAESSAEAPVYAAHSWVDGRRKDQPFSVWRPHGPDSIRVQRAGALAGVMLQVAPTNDALTGNVIVYRDVSMANTPTQRNGPVRMAPTRCPDT